MAAREIRKRPEWSQAFLYAEELSSRAEREREEALARRCPAEDSGGARCTADAKPEHRHRYYPEELPPYGGSWLGVGYDFEPVVVRRDGEA